MTEGGRDRRTECSTVQYRRFCGCVSVEGGELLREGVGMHKRNVRAGENARLRERRIRERYVGMRDNRS